MDRRRSAPYLSSRNNLRDEQNPATVTVTVQVEYVPRKKPVKRKTKLWNDGDNGKKSHRRKMKRLARSKSFNENPFDVATSARETVAKVNSQRRNSVPSVLNESAPEGNLSRRIKKWLLNEDSKRQTSQRRKEVRSASTSENAFIILTSALHRKETEVKFQRRNSSLTCQRT